MPLHTRQGPLQSASLQSDCVGLEPTLRLEYHELHRKDTPNHFSQHESMLEEIVFCRSDTPIVQADDAVLGHSRAQERNEARRGQRELLGACLQPHVVQHLLPHIVEVPAGGHVRSRCRWCGMERSGSNGVTGVHCVAEQH